MKTSGSGWESELQKENVKYRNVRAFLLISIPVTILQFLTISIAGADGFSSRIGVGLLVLNHADNLSGRGNSTLGSLNDKPRSFTRVYPVPAIELRYSWEGNTVFYGASADEPLGIGLGYRRKLDKGAVSGSAFYSFFGREWQNPYLVGTPRSETRVNSYGGRVAFEEVGGTPLTLAVKGSVKNIVDEELSGELRRDGGLLDVDLSWRQRLSQSWVVVPLLGYQRGDYLGDANSFHGARFGVGADWRGGDLMIATRLSGSVSNYDELHPIFNKTRRDTGYRFSSFARLENPFGWRNYFASAAIIHSNSESNIDFFTTGSLIGLAAFGYQF